MNIVFVIEHFFPFDKGGSEWSTYYLAKELVKKGHLVTIVTPNYGSKSIESINDIKIVRFPFYKKTKTFVNIPGNFFYTNPLFVIWTAICLLVTLDKVKPDVIHIQGKYSILPAKIANIYLKRPIFATIRDYIPICNYGVCLLKDDQACNFAEYYLRDFRQYYKSYVFPKNIINLISNILMSVWGRLSSRILQLISKNMHVVVLSKKQENIFATNGYKNLQVIYNCYEFPKNPRKSKKGEIVTYAGRLTPGKGLNLIYTIYPEFARKYPNYKFYLIGDGFLKKKFDKLGNKYKNLKVLGNIPHRKLLEIFSKSKVVLAPSIWPEPFGRVVLEAFATNTAVLVGKGNGLAPVVNDRWGLAAKPNPGDTLLKLESLIQNNEAYVQRINKDYKKIKKMFGSDVINKHIKLYNSLFK